jgi:dihydroflavonol-4-reductase
MRVLVTGANGHLGANLVAQLLAAGHQVRGSVRDAGDSARTAHIAALGEVEIVTAELDDARSLRAAMDGMDAVMHTAAVYQLYAPGQEQAILRASVEGIEAALRAAKDAGVRKVVLTSSVVTLPLVVPGGPASTEEHWASDLRVPYLRAKTLGEQKAWELSKALGIDLVSILPGAFGGPGFRRPTPTIDLVDAIARGALQIIAPPINYPYVDVRDVAHAHVLALEKNARGRFIAVNDHQPTLAEMARTMNEIDRSIPAPLVTLPGMLMPMMPLLDALSSRINDTPRSMTPDLAGTLSGKQWRLANDKIRRELGWEPMVSMRDSLADTIEALRALRRR